MGKRLGRLGELFFCFLKIGSFTFGGGYAMLSIITDLCVEKKQWLTQDEMMNLTVVAESTPGPMAINCATFVGYKTAGFAGAVAATLGVVLPSFLIIYCISSFLDDVMAYTWVMKAFRGIKIGVGLLIMRVGLGMLRKLPGKPLPRLFALWGFGAMLAVNFFALRISTITIMLAAGLTSVAIFAGKGGGRT